MTVRRERSGVCRRARGVLPTMLGLAATPAAAQPPVIDPPVRLTYAVYAGGLEALRLQTRVRVAGGRYDIRVRATTTGWVASLFPFVLKGRAHGAAVPGGLRPERFVTANRWRDSQGRWVRVRYTGAMPTPGATAVPPPAADGRAPVPPIHRRGTRDPISAIHALLLTGDTPCGGARSIFDGRRHYTLRADAVGDATIAGDSYSVFSGRARVCRVRLAKGGGFWRDPDRRGQYPDTVRVWLGAPTEALPPLPVRMAAETRLGGLRVHLTGVARGGELPDDGLLPPPDTPK